MTSDAKPETADLVARLRQLEASLAKKDAQIALSARLSDEIAAAKDGQIAEGLQHIARFDASPWWRLGKGLEKLVLAPYGVVLRLISLFGPKNASAAKTYFISDRDYQRWIDLYDTISEQDRAKIRDHIQGLYHQPLISIVMLPYDAPEKVFRSTIESVRAQLYTNWELCIADDAARASSWAEILKDIAPLDPRIKWVKCTSDGLISEAGNLALAAANGEFIIFLCHDDILPEQALYEVVVELNASPEADIIYSDEDRIGSDGFRHSPNFKSDWNQELFLVHDMISHFCGYRHSLIKGIGGFRPGYEASLTYDLTLRAVGAAKAENIRHIPAILVHRGGGAVKGTFLDDRSADEIESARRAKSDYFAARNELAAVMDHPYVPGFDRVQRPIPSPAPLVSLIVPTRNRADLLGPCVEGLLRRTTYKPIEVIIIDHQSDDAETVALLKRLSADARVRIMPYQGPFNYSDMNNKAVAEARGELIGLINNDIDVIAPDWLSEMVSFAVVSENGAIGAKLLYPNGRVQHGGVITGLPWGMSHAHTGAERNEMGYFGRLMAPANVSAVTGACLVVRKRLFEEAGGLNAVDLPIAFNDVDLCLEIRARGYRNVWTPFALLYHHESVSRGSDAAPDKVERASRDLYFMRRKWGHAVEFDPYFNVNLALPNPSFALAFPPRRIKPWRSSAAIRLVQQTRGT
jgi:glycosyltransferase involved in cell wall biosynthesis